MQRVTLRYDGKYNFMPPPDDRQWTITSDFYDTNGCNRKRGSFGLRGLQELGIIKALTSNPDGGILK